jgi:hypothetical protein
MMSTVPLGAVQEMTTLSNAFSAEFDRTAGPAVSIVTRRCADRDDRSGAHGAVAGKIRC